jgi:hypothetical protein
MLLKRFYDDPLAQASFLVGDTTTRTKRSSWTPIATSRRTSWRLKRKTCASSP